MNKFFCKAIGWVIVTIMVLFAAALIYTLDVKDWAFNVVLGCGLIVVSVASKDIVKWLINGGKIQ